MSEDVRYQGYLEEVGNPNNLSLEELAKTICKQRGLELCVWCDTYLETLLDSDETDNGYVVLNDRLYQIQELEELDINEEYCDIYQTVDGRYRFETQFYNGGTCLKEMLESEW